MYDFYIDFLANILFDIILWRGIAKMNKSQYTFRNRMPIPTDWSQVPLFVDTAYIANMTQIGNETIRKLCQNGVIPATKIGQAWRIAKDDFIACFNSLKEGEGQGKKRDI
ncbi:MAG: helix-turn-helix domain-containing protein [Eubacterium sp.]|jgi:excisionase family DNA binding protein|nr:helix-turn-helix domain-containing protein [Eubacterium sp.]